jgi:hypothetical protein
MKTMFVMAGDQKLSMGMAVSHLLDFIPVSDKDISEDEYNSLITGPLTEYLMYCNIHLSKILGDTHPGLVPDLCEVFQCKNMKPHILAQVGLYELNDSNPADLAEEGIIYYEGHRYIWGESATSFSKKYGPDSLRAAKPKLLMMMLFDERISSHGLTGFTYDV